MQYYITKTILYLRYSHAVSNLVVQQAHCIAKMPASEYKSAFGFLFNFITAAERLEL